MSRVDEILEFWFGKADESGYGKTRSVWFTKNPEFDEKVREAKLSRRESLFFDDYELAAAGKLDFWQETPEGCLALIILLDQFPRNMFRDRPQAFATDAKALSIAQHAVNRGFDKQLLPVQCWFVYLPFEHSENLEHQRLCVELYRQWNDDSIMASGIEYALRHLEIIERFGRFPHRNEILGRETTSEEAEFLKQPGSSF